MGTKPKDPADMQRPLRRLGDIIRAMIGCPLCRLDPEINHVRVVAYRQHSIRLECPVCGLRFTVDRHQLIETISHPGESESRPLFTSAYAWAIWTRHES
jgi:transcription elongation factor Elf1